MKKRKENPRMLKHVLEAVINLKDAHGSTCKKIIDHIHRNVNEKPRHVVMQIKKALEHAVTSGALKHKAGKYRLTLPSEIKMPKLRARKGVKRLRRLKKPKKNSRRPRHRPRRRLDNVRSSASATSTATRSSYSSRSKAGYSVTGYSDKEARSIRRRRRSIAKKTVQISSDALKKKPKRTRMRRPRQQTPMPTADDAQVAESETCQELARQIENLENDFTDNSINQDAEVFDNNESLVIEEIPPECCGNPECLCNLKQEPSEDNNSDEVIVGNNTTNNIDGDVPDDVSEVSDV